MKESADCNQLTKKSGILHARHDGVATRLLIVNAAMATGAESSHIEMMASTCSVCLHAV